MGVWGFCSAAQYNSHVEFYGEDTRTHAMPTDGQMAFPTWPKGPTKTCRTVRRSRITPGVGQANKLDFWCLFPGARHLSLLNNRKTHTITRLLPG
jgi:hypothetical protein